MKKEIIAMYFSPTGTTKKICEAIAGKIAASLRPEIKPRSIDFTLPQARAEAQAFKEGELVVFGVPVIAGRVPNVLLPCLKEIRGGGAWAVPVVLYGNRNYDDALIELKDILELNGFQILAAAAFIGEHSFSRILAANRPDDQDLALADEFAQKIYRKISSLEILPPLTVKGNSPYRGYYRPKNRQGEYVDIRKVAPKTSEACIRCGLCSRVCPMGSISPEDPSQITGICIKCGACQKSCPVEAKYYDDPNYLWHKEELEREFTRRAEPELFI